jgi:hypothetical protein
MHDFSGQRGGPPNPTRSVEHRCIDADYELAGMIGQLASLRRRAGAGQPVDLSRLPEQIDRIGKVIELLPPEQWASYRGLLATVMADLDRLLCEIAARGTAVLRRQLEVDPSG